MIGGIDEGMAREGFTGAQSWVKYALKNKQSPVSLEKARRVRSIWRASLLAILAKAGRGE